MMAKRINAVAGKIAIQTALSGYAIDEINPPVNPNRDNIRSDLKDLAVETVRNNSSLHLVDGIFCSFGYWAVSVLRDLV